MLLSITSKKERNLWIITLLIMVVIFSTLFIGRPLLDLFKDQNHQAIIFASGMLLIAIAIALHAFMSKSSKIEIALIIGVLAIYLMLFLRLGLPERSHVMEYSILAIAIHKTLIERHKNGALKFSPAFIAMVLTILIGCIDECLQLFIPDRVFDYYDIIFNMIVTVTAIGFHGLIGWLRKLISKKKSN